jgi:hypothetical protein
LSNSQLISSTDSSATLSSNTLSTLNSAFQQLIGDLGGTSSSGSSSSSTTALQSFLSTLLQNLQGGGGSASLSALGNSVNATA